MVDSTMSLLDSLWSAAKWLFVVVMGMIGYKVKRTDEAIDDLKKNTIRTDDFNSTLASLRGDIKSLGDKQVDLHKTMRSDTREDIKGVHSRIDELMKR